MLSKGRLRDFTFWNFFFCFWCVFPRAVAITSEIPLSKWAWGSMKKIWHHSCLFVQWLFLGLVPFHWFYTEDTMDSGLQNFSQNDMAKQSMRNKYLSMCTSHLARRGNRFCLRKNGGFWVSWSIWFKVLVRRKAFGTMAETLPEDVYILYQRTRIQGLTIFLIPPSFLRMHTLGCCTHEVSSKDKMGQIPLK